MDKTILTEQNKHDILKLFYREPYFEEVIVDNGDATIAKELGLSHSSVILFLSDYLNKKYSKLFNEV